MKMIMKWKPKWNDNGNEIILMKILVKDNSINERNERRKEG